MELKDILSPIASLVVGFFGALFGARQANAVWKREQQVKRTLALRNYERSLYDMALHLEGVEEPMLGSHPEPDDLEETRRAAFPYFQEFERSDYYKLIAPHPGSGSRSAMEDSNWYADISRIIKKKLDAEKSRTGRKKPVQRWLTSLIGRGGDQAESLPKS